MMNRPLFWEIIVAFIASYWIISHYFSGNTKFEELALGTETVAYQAMDKTGTLIHIQHIKNEESAALTQGWKKRGSKKVTFFLGNSQTHSINQLKEGDVNFIELLANHTTDSTEVLCHSMPNASLQEFYLSYSYWKNIVPIRTMVVPLFLDDMREDGIRGDIFFTDLVENRFQLADSTDDLIHKINRELRLSWVSDMQGKTQQAGENNISLEETFQERSERFLNNTLDEYSLIWRNRTNVRGDFFNWLYKLRNTVFGINANTIRKMIPQRYALNMHALNLLVQDCVAKKVKVLLYIPPIRSDVKLPYDESDYRKFKEEVIALSQRYPGLIYYRNFEDIIPADLWGYKAATNLRVEREVDFMHFQFKGHQILADSIHHALVKLKEEK